MSVNNTGNSMEVPICQYYKKPHRGQCRQQSNLCYGCGGNDHCIRNYPQNANQASTRPHVHPNTTQVNKIRSPKQAQSMVQGRGKASYSNAQTNQESRAFARMYHVKGREDEESSDVMADQGLEEIVEEPRLEQTKRRGKGIVIRDQRLALHVRMFYATLGLELKMSDSRIAQNSTSRGSSTEGDNIEIQNNPVNPPEQRQDIPPQNQVPLQPDIPTIQEVQRECLMGMKEMFNQLVTSLRQDQQNAQVATTPSKAPIEKLAEHRAYTFVGAVEEKPEKAEYWLDRITQIVTSQLSCSDEHKLECVVALLADEALSWWETTILTAPKEKITWKFFNEEFKKKYISEQYLNDRRNRFLHLKQANKPVEQYVAEFCKYCKYGAEYIKTEKDKCRKFTDGLNDELGPMFTAMEITDFQILVNRVMATEAKLRFAWLIKSKI
ncbi:hypothetical protein GQ457_18G008990 [Hibiscus cannabinus]